MSKKNPYAPPPEVNPDGLDFDMLPELAGFHLRRAQISVFNRFGRQIARDRVTPGQFGILVLINANRGLTQSALAKAVGVERSTMVATIDGLEQKGLVERRPSPVDRRSYALTLTPTGKSLLTKLKRKVREHEKRTYDGFTDEERETLIRLLHRIWSAG